MAGLASIIEEGIRYPGFAFINVESPCVTYGEEDHQLKDHRAAMIPLQSLGHDPSNRLKAMDLAQEYGTKLYTGVFYRNPVPPPTFEALARERQAKLSAGAPTREKILDLFLQH